MILIAGPCVIEGRDFLLKMAARLEKFAHLDGVEFYFKSSFDKANRTSISSFRGPGLERGCEILAEVKREFGYRLLTDIHEPAQAAVAAQVVDMLQIPAFLCRQTDLVVAAAKTSAKINIKKGQFLSADAMRHIVVKALQTRAGADSANSNLAGAGVGVGGADCGDASGANCAGADSANSNLAGAGVGVGGADCGDASGANCAGDKNGAGGAGENLRDITAATLTHELAARHGICVCERGNSFGYGNLVVDMRNLAIMREFAPVIFDATHSVQMPAGAATTGGDSRFVPLLARAAAAAGVDGFFYETHIAPREALSDGANMLDIAAFEASLGEVMRVREALGERG